MELALFDLDNTLLSGDSDYEWAQFLIEQGVLERASLKKANAVKPGDLLFRRAQQEIPAIDLAQALYIGDRMRDVEAGLGFGGNGVIVPHAETPPSETLRAVELARVAPSLAVALDWYLCTN